MRFESLGDPSIGQPDDILRSLDYLRPHSLIALVADAVAGGGHGCQHGRPRTKEWVQYRVALDGEHVDQAVRQLERERAAPFSAPAIGNTLNRSLQIKPHVRKPVVALFPEEGAFAPLLPAGLRSEESLVPLAQNEDVLVLQRD